MTLPVSGKPSDASAAAAFTPPVPEPPVQFGSFLLCAAEAQSLEFFREVKGKYALVTRRDPSFQKFLDEIEAKVFGIQAQKSGIGAIFDMLLGGGSSDG